MMVEMYRTSDSENDTVPPGVWEVQLPNGTILDTTGTKTQGLQEAINYACEHGRPLRVYGGQVKHSNGQNPAIIMCTAPLVFPPLELANIEIDATLNFCGPNPQPIAVSVDSVMASRVIWTGQIVCASGWGCGINFKPRTELPCDQNGPVITASTIHLPSVVMVGAGTCIHFDATLGSISGNLFEILEPNGGTVGIKVTTSATRIFDHNHLLVRECHGQPSCIVAGNLAHGATVFGNTWNVSLMPLSVGAEIFGHNEHWIISIDDREGTPACGFTLNPGAAHNIIDVLMNDAANKINNASGNFLNSIRMP